MGNLTQKWTQSGCLFPKSGNFLRFSKNGRDGLSHFPSSCRPMSVTEYASVSLDIPKYL